MSYLLYLLLYRVGIRISELRIRAIYDRHPLPHSIRALSDTLDDLQVPNRVRRLQFRQLITIGKPVIVVAGDSEFPFFLVEKSDEITQKILLRSVSGQTSVLSFEEFRNRWDGTVLMVGKDEQVREEARVAYYMRQCVAFIDRTTEYWVAGLFLVLVGWMLLHAPAAVDWVALGLLGILGAWIIYQLAHRAVTDRQAKQLKYKHEQLLNSPDTFWHLLARQPETQPDSTEAMPVSNYAEADHTLTVIMDPACPQCAKVHRAISSLQNYRIDLIFIVNKGDNRSYDAALRIVSSGIRDTWSETDRIISGWYATRTFPPQTDVHPLARKDLEAQIAYCNRIGIAGTPTVLVDNRRLPPPYSAEDIRYIL
ncbi:MAG: thioredoxin fold domain-containing protein [Alistipes sp.]|nr:thioredoxin fold domain-containing protein [Alistipes sp.]MDE6507141.1 thioredoxin fold domain-containing protein [Alistipes sp.]